MKLKHFTFQTEIILSGLFIVFFSWDAKAQCNNNAGTIKNSYYIGQSTKNDISDTVFLCWRDRLYIEHNDDYDVSSDPVLATSAGIGYGWYKSVPTVSGVTLADIKADDIFRFNGDPAMMISVGRLNGAVMFENGYFSGNVSFNKVVNGAGNPTLMFYAPMTIDQRKGNRGYYENGGTCLNVNIEESFPIVYLNPIKISDMEYNVGGDPLKVSFVVKGGLPEYYLFHDNRKVNYKSINIYNPENPIGKYFGQVLTQNFSHGDRVEVKLSEFGSYTVNVEDGVSCSGTNSVSVVEGINPTLSLDTVSGKQNDIVYVTFSVKNFNSVALLLGRFDYDPSVLEYIGIYPENVLTMVEEYPGLLRMSWNTIFQTYPDGKEIFKLSFKLVGSEGECSPVIMKNFQGADTDVKDLYPDLENGLICIDTPDTLSISTTYCGAKLNVPDASISFKVFKGTAPYSYIVTDSSGTTIESGIIPEAKINTTVYGLYSGKKYNIAVTDADGTVIEESLFLHDILPLEFESIDITKPDCYNMQNGKISIKVKDAAINSYNTKWSDNIYGTDSLLFLSNGIYSVTIIDKTTGCQTDTALVLNTPKINYIAKEINTPECFGDCNGSIILDSIENANGMVSFYWNTGDSDESLLDICAGNYFVTVTDKNGCSTVKSFLINSINKVSIKVDTVIDITSSGLGAILIGSDNNDYIYDWSGPNGYKSEKMNIFGLKDAGCYTLVVTDTTTSCSVDTTVCIADKTGFVDLGKTDIELKIYPNPADNITYFDFDGDSSASYKVTIYNVEGDEIIGFMVNSYNKIYKLNTSEMASGMYIVKIQSKQSLRFKTFAVNR